MSGTNEDVTTSPKARLKLLCSYGGKILPRPTDGMLKYVGGETRVVTAPRTITFADFKEKINGMYNNADTVIKYQVIPEDLDVLVSVRNDEDLTYMIEEYDRHESLPRSPSSYSRFRIYIFPSSSVLPQTPRSPRYMDILNSTSGTPIPIQNRANMNLSNSVCTSPTTTVDFRTSGKGMQRVKSTPNLSGTVSTMGYQQKSRMGGAASGVHFQVGGGHFGHFHGGGGHAYHHGYVEEVHRPRSGQGSYHFSGQPPVAPRRSIWE